MGGAQTLNIGIPNLDKFAYLGVFSSGVFGIAPGPSGNQARGPGFDEKNQAALDDPKLKDGLKLVWFATGKDDFLLSTSWATVGMLKSTSLTPFTKKRAEHTLGTIGAST